MSLFGGLDPEKHLLHGDGRGCEENTKVKVVVPWLLHLGWNLNEDLYFEEQRADILLRWKGRPFLVVEVKAWEHPFRDAERAQLLEHALNHGTPWALFAPGDRFLLYHALGLVRRGGKALVEARFAEIRGGRDVLSGLLRKPSQGDPEEPLRRLCTEDQPEAAWRKLAAERRPVRHSPARMTPARFQALLEKLTPQHREAFDILLAAFQALVEDFPGLLRLKWQSKSAGLHVSDPSSERGRWPGLAGLYPENPKRPQMSTAYGGWKALGFPEERYKPLQNLIWKFTEDPAPARSREIAAALRALLSEASGRRES